jgi:hypothetical protein
VYTQRSTWLVMCALADSLVLLRNRSRLSIVIAMLPTEEGWHESALNFERSSVDSPPLQTSEDHPPFHDWIQADKFLGQSGLEMRMVKSGSTGGQVQGVVREILVQ